jgi:hypothetical protein
MKWMETYDNDGLLVGLLHKFQLYSYPSQNFAKKTPIPNITSRLGMRIEIYAFHSNSE